MRARIAKIAVAALLAVGSAAVITVATASASEDTGTPIPALSASGLPEEPAPTLTELPGSTPAPEPGSTTAPPPGPGSTTTPPPEQSTTTASPPEPDQTTTPPPEQGKSAEQPPLGYNGTATYYDAGVGACGQVFRDSDFVVALGPSMFGSGYPAPHCGRKVVVTHNGESIIATVLDESPGSGRYGLSLTRAAFEALAPLDLGGIDVTWSFVE